MFDMLDYALTHRKAVNGITQKWELELRMLELTNEEWKIIEQLHEVLGVCAHVYLVYAVLT